MVVDGCCKIAFHLIEEATVDFAENRDPLLDWSHLHHQGGVH